MKINLSDFVLFMNEMDHISVKKEQCFNITWAWIRSLAEQFISDQKDSVFNSEWVMKNNNNPLKINNLSCFFFWIKHR
jgi:hypothetical protein